MYPIKGISIFTWIYQNHEQIFQEYIENLWMYPIKCISIFTWIYENHRYIIKDIWNVKALKAVYKRRKSGVQTDQIFEKNNIKPV